MLVYLCFVLLLLHSVISQTTDKYSDEDRPYKFGFNIQGYQHRQEEKDERGLIKGEYGFITADGYYRVTVYATDENGDFRIISMKNYYVGFPPEDPTTTPGSPTNRGSNNPLQPQTFGRAPGAAGRALGVDDSTQTTPNAFTRPQGIAACSDCSIPTTPRPNQGNPQANAGDFRSGRTGGGNFGSAVGQGFGGQSPRFPQANPLGNVQTPGDRASPFPQTPNVQGPTVGQTPSFPQTANVQGSRGGQTPSFPQGAPRSNVPFSGFSGGNAPSAPGSSFGEGNPQRPGVGANGSFGSRDSGFPRGRTDFTQNTQQDGTPQRRPQIGEVRDGLPPGVTLNDIKDLLYTFNYTVGFHGHHEDGYRNGDKQGDYFFDGRDGVERKVEYLANEFGYQPNITLIDLPENDVRRPNEQTEKEYGLKGYEFKWFYRK